jgi:transglutaminase-like putative cysteine protease
MRHGLQSGCATAYQPTPRIFSAPIPDGDAGVRETVRWMKSLVHGNEGVRSWEVRQAALEAVRGVERGQTEIDSVFNWVRDRIEFRGEYGETLQSPRITLLVKAGDCDDQSMLMAAMLQSLGFETRFRTIALTNSADEFSHVYAEVRDKQTGQWLPVDTTVQTSYPGWQPDDIARTQTYGTMGPQGGGKVLGGLALAGLAALFL